MLYLIFRCRSNVRNYRNNYSMGLTKISRCVGGEKVKKLLKLKAEANKCVLLRNRDIL